MIPFSFSIMNKTFVVAKKGNPENFAVNCVVVNHPVIYGCFKKKCSGLVTDI